MTEPWTTVVTVTASLGSFLGVQAVLRAWAVHQRRRAIRYVESIQQQVLCEIRNPARLEAISGVRGAAARQQEYLDSICRRAAAQLHMPASIMTVVDDEVQSTIASWAPDGHPMEVGLEKSFCKYVVAFRKPLVIEDALHDELVLTNGGAAQVHREGLRSYLGVPLYIGPDNEHVVGSLCVFDKRAPHQWTDRDMLALEALADLVDLNTYDWVYATA